MFAHLPLFIWHYWLGRCAEFLWPSKNIRSLITHLSSRCGLVEETNLDEHAVFELDFWNDIGNYLGLFHHRFLSETRAIWPNEGAVQTPDPWLNCLPHLSDLCKKSRNETFLRQKVRISFLEAVHKLCRLGRGEEVAPKTIYYRDPTQ